MKYSLLSILFLICLSCATVSEQLPNSSVDYQVIPKPQSLKMKNGQFEINRNTKISGTEQLVNEGIYLAEEISLVSGLSLGYDVGQDGDILLKLDPAIADEEGYSLSVDVDKIIITGKSPKGVFYGIQTLRQLLPPGVNAVPKDQNVKVPAVIIADAPRYAYRGMHLDVARHFFPVSFVKRYIDLLAMHKMNTFHWHLTEDQGWRIEIKQYPKLTEVGAWRNGTIVGHYPGTENDNKRYGGFYTQDQIREVVDYAAKRHITVIPEIELPGHSSAAIAAYPYLSCFPEERTVVPNEMMSEASKKAQADGQPKIVQESWGVYKDVYCVGKEETFTFIEGVLDEVVALFPSTYIHIGGDECPKEYWEKSPESQTRKAELNLADEHELQSYFIKRVEKYLNSKGKQIIGWDEILEGGLAPNATVMSWRGNAGGIAAANAGHKVVMSPNSHCYFDHYQSEDTDKEPLAIGGFLPVEKVYSFDPVPTELSAENQQYILGGQANLWTEYIDTEKHAEYMLLPRMTALSEALWTAKEQKDYEDFKGRLTGFRSRYDAMNLNYAKHVFESDL
ncbi:MAG: beta-N-acetylhexosaminidase [Bacteroidota bacterium]